MRIKLNKSQIAGLTGEGCLKLCFEVDSSSKADRLTVTGSEVDGGIYKTTSFANVVHRGGVSVMGVVMYEVTMSDAKVINDDGGRKVGKTDFDGMLTTARDTVECRVEIIGDDERPTSSSVAQRLRESQAA